MKHAAKTGFAFDYDYCAINTRGMRDNINSLIRVAYETIPSNNSVIIANAW